MKQSDKKGSSRGRLNAHLLQGKRGVTLLELMIVVTIIAILGAIAYPSYLNQVRTSNRADAQSDLMQLASYMERYFTENSSYLDPDDNPITLPFSSSPQDGTARYTIAFPSSPAPTRTTFTLRATPVSGGTNDGDGFLQINSLGAKAWDRDNNGSIASPGEQCWKKSC